MFEISYEVKEGIAYFLAFGVPVIFAIYAMLVINYFDKHERGHKKIHKLKKS